MKRTKHTIDFESDEKPEILFNIAQACNEFQIQGLIRKHALKKYKDFQYTKTEWENLFHAEKIV
jgi:hypothetical protein